MEIHYKNIYTLKNNEPILVIYNISARHYIGLPLSKSKEKDCFHIPSIDFYYNSSKIKEYKYLQFANCLYIKGKPLLIKDSEFKTITDNVKKYYLDNILIKTSENTIDNFIFDKWIFDKLYLNNTENGFLSFDIIRPKAVYWINFGYGVGSELRKLRPAILWRHTADKKICTFIPLSSKCCGDNSYYHCDLTCLNESTAKLECMQNLSYKRIVESYRINGKPLYINNKDFKLINEKLNRYYVYS